MKLKIMPVFVLASMLSAGITANSTGWNSGSVHIKIDDFQRKSVNLGQRNDYDELQIKSLSEGYEIGKPDVPVKYFTIAAPVDGEISVQVNYSNPEKITNLNLKPTQDPVADISSYKLIFKKDEQAYAASEFSPRDKYTVSPKMISRGIAYYQVAVYPVRYNPSAKEALIYKDTELTYSVSGNFAIDSRLYFPSMHEQNFANCLNGREFSKINRVVSKSSTDIDGEYLIITHPDFRAAADKFADWKMQLGLSTKVVDLTETGNTEQSIITYIKTAYTTWRKPPKYVLLVGDAGTSTGSVILPTGYHTDHPYTTGYGSGHKTGTDLYYAAVDGNDIAPDLSTGRILCDTQAEALNQIDRIINYEKTPPDQSSFYQNVLNACYFQDDNKDGYADRRFTQTTEEMRDYLIKKVGKNSTRVYVTGAAVTPTNWNTGTYSNGEPIPAELLRSNGFAWNGNAANITAKINEGIFLLTHRDHGFYKGWGDPSYLCADVQSLKNGNKTPVVFSINCETGWFDNETDNYSTTTNDDKTLFAENWVRNTAGGAVGYVGATRVSYSGQNDYFAEALVNGTTGNRWTNDQNSYGDDFANFNTPDFPAASCQPGVALNYAKMYTLSKMAQSSTYLTTLFEQMIYMGDPSMRIWLQQPAPISLSGLPASIGLGENKSVTIATGLANATVSFYSKNDIFITGQTDASGNFQCNLSPKEIAAISVTVSAPDKIPAIKTIEVVQGALPYIAFVAPQNNAILLKGSQVTIQAQANDLKRAVSKVEFFVDDSKIGEVTSAPYNYVWNTSQSSLGNHDLKVKVTDNEGNFGSRQIKVSLSDGLPILAILEPTEGQTINSPGPFEIKVQTHDPVKSVSKVEFFLDDTKIGTSTTAPYSYIWNTTGVTAGKHKIKAVLSDNTGNKAEKETNITVVTYVINETFAATGLPTGWTQQNVGSGLTNRWSVVTSNEAGGSGNELKATFKQISPATSRIITPAISTNNVSKFNIVFNHMFDDYGPGVTLRVQSSTDLTTWKNESWSLASVSNNEIGPEVIYVAVTPSKATGKIYFAWALEGDLYQFDAWYVDDIKISAILDSSDIDATVTPNQFLLAQNYPNPFNPSTTINFALPADSKIELGIYNIKGELVKQLVNGQLKAGNHNVVFDASGYNSGVYFYKLTDSKNTITGKMLMLK